MINNILNVIPSALSIVLLITMMMILTEFINLKINNSRWLNKPLHPLIQVVIASLIGLLPGCAGIFVVASLFIHRKVLLPALWAACVTSFGDEVFFMWSLIPAQTVYIVFILFLLAVSTGWLFYLIPAFNRFLQPKETQCADTFNHHCHNELEKKGVKKSHTTALKILFCAVLLSFSIFCILGLVTEDGHFAHYAPISAISEAQMHTAETGHHWENIVFAAIALLCATLIAFAKPHFFKEHIVRHILYKHLPKIILWVFLVMLVIAILTQLIDLQYFISIQQSHYILLAIALLVGLIPQSGPHLIILFMYLNGWVPFSVLLANTIVQEGHGGLVLLAFDAKKYAWIKIAKFAIAAVIGFCGIYFL
ncbi:MAG: putative manganese transporter [Bacteroidales bacterium]|jgi:hypothetical protein|nr:putative manganese transporter [Bacteroidales bacterium]